MIQVDSSNLFAVDYNQLGNCLDVLFRSGAMYRYSEVPVEMYGQLLAAPSKGKFFNNNIRTSYSYEKIYPEIL